MSNEIFRETSGRIRATGATAAAVTGRWNRADGGSWTGSRHDRPHEHGKSRSYDECEGADVTGPQVRTIIRNGRDAGMRAGAVMALLSRLPG